MSFLKYDDYKQTEHSWIGEIPASWVIKRVGHHIEFITGFAFKSDNFSFRKGIKLVRGDNVTEGKLRWGDKTRYWPEISHAYEQFLLCENDILIGMDGSKVGKNYALVKSSDLPLLLVQRVARLRTDEHLSYKFLAHLIGSDLFRTWVNLVKTDPAIPHISPSDIRGFPLPFPSKNEQDKIADFLDHETAKIDTLIEKQKQLIKLLKEKRQAVISNAVTKGLNPEAPMKDSGVEWLGEVPEHWVPTTLKYQAKIVDCKHITAEFYDSGKPLASIGEVKQWHVNLSTAKFTSLKFYKLLIEGGRKPVAGDIIYSRNATVGEAALVPDTIAEFAMGQDVCLIRPDANLLPEFLLFCLKSGIVKSQLDLAMIGSTFKRINVDNIRNFKLVLPPHDEQIEITGKLEKTLSKYDSLIGKSEINIELMQERRLALISAAVTGKIDVRNWQPTNNKNTEEIEVTA